MSARPIHVLVVDDEPALRRVFRTSLAASGFVIKEARSGEEAVDILPQHPFDLVLLDINMPGIGGVEACREIRALAPKIGILMVTVRDAEHDMVRAPTTTSPNPSAFANWWPECGPYFAGSMRTALPNRQ